MYLLQLEEYLAHSKWTINISWLNEFMIKKAAFGLKDYACAEVKTRIYYESEKVYYFLLF